MTREEGIKKIEDLINEFAKISKSENNDEFYMDMMDEMGNRATDAYNTRGEELNREEP